MAVIAPSTGLDFSQGDGRALFADYLNSIGLGSLGDAAWQKWLENPNPGEFALWLRGTAEYKQRFPYAEDLRKRGIPFTEAGAISYEQNARSLLHAVGVPDGFVTQDYLNKLIAGNISYNELEQRVASNISEYELAPEVVKQEFRNQLGDEGALIGFFLDPQHTMQQFQAIRANALVRGYGKQFGLNLANTDAQYALGLSAQQVQQGLSQVAELGALGRGTIDQVTATSDEQLASDVFTGVTGRIRKQLEQRAAEFGDAGSSNTGQQPGFGVARGA